MTTAGIKPRKAETVLDQWALWFWWKLDVCNPDLWPRSVWWNKDPDCSMWNQTVYSSRALLVLRLVEAVGQAAFAAVMAVEVTRHEDASAAFVSRTLAPQTVDLTVLIHLQIETVSSWREEAPPSDPRSPAHLVVLEHGQLDLLPLVFVLLGCGVGLLLPLLGTASQPQHQVQSGLLQTGSGSERHLQATRTNTEPVQNRSEILCCSWLVKC